MPLPKCLGCKTADVWVDGNGVPSHLDRPSNQRRLGMVWEELSAESRLGRFNAGLTNVTTIVTQ
ncbi:hypothetical protein BC938DRAFT_483512, partial [Jimgerdemannia flammicorona]